jgi:predicted amidophosphoribosyltransferase
VDDVVTTGATLEACARELLKAGALSVDIHVIAFAKE